METNHDQPAATATPRTDEELIKSLVTLGINERQAADLVEMAKPAIRAQEELTAAKAEIARLSNLGWFGKYHKAEADNAQLRAQLRERTQWQCACGGTDCAGQAENERLRAEVERQTRETTKWAQSLLARTEAAEVRAARWKEQAEFSETQRTKLDGENDQLRARVAELESQLAASATKAAAEYGEQLKPLFAKVRELEQDKARLVEVAHDAVSYVGAANYRERQEEAHEMIDSACAGEQQT